MKEVTASTKMSQLSAHHPLGQLSHRGRSLTVFPKSGSDAFLWLPSFSWWASDTLITIYLWDPAKERQMGTRNRWDMRHGCYQRGGFEAGKQAAVELSGEINLLITIWTWEACPPRPPLSCQLLKSADTAPPHGLPTWEALGVAQDGDGDEEWGCSSPQEADPPCPHPQCVLWGDVSPARDKPKRTQGREVVVRNRGGKLSTALTKAGRGWGNDGDISEGNCPSWRVLPRPPSVLPDRCTALLVSLRNHIIYFSFHVFLACFTSSHFISALGVAVSLVPSQSHPLRNTAGGNNPSLPPKPTRAL